MLVEQFLPVFDFREVHSTVIRATPRRVFEAIKLVTPEEIPLVAILFAIRGLPARFTGRPALAVSTGASLLEQALRAGFVMLAESPDQELVLGTVGRFWSLRGGSSFSVSTPAEFVAFNRPGYAKAVLNFYLVEMGVGRVELSTETRILTLDSASRRKFGLYWRVIYPGSALIRRMWLGAIRRHSERA